MNEQRRVVFKFSEPEERMKRDRNKPLTAEEIIELRKEAGENAPLYAYKVKGCTCASCDGGMPVCK